MAQKKRKKKKLNVEDIINAKRGMSPSWEKPFANMFALWKRESPLLQAFGKAIDAGDGDEFYDALTEEAKRQLELEMLDEILDMSVSVIVELPPHSLN